MLKPASALDPRMDEAYFRARYDADKANQQKQSWKEHQDWVRSFYEGKRFPPVAGWNDRQKDLLKTAPQSKGLIEEVGRLLASEWAKDNSVRKVSTGDLQTWGKRFSDAAKTPATLDAALREVKAEVEKRTGSA